MSRKWVSESISILYVIGRDLITTTKSSTEDEEYDNFDWEWLFHVVIVPVFQAWWKMINFWWIAIDLWTSVETVELDGTRPKNYPILIRIWSNSVGFLVELNVQVHIIGRKRFLPNQRSSCRWQQNTKSSTYMYLYVTVPAYPQQHQSGTSSSVRFSVTQ